MNQDYSFSSNGYIEKNMEDMKEYLIDNGNDHMVILVIGGVNTAKSSLTTWIEYFLNQGTVTHQNYAYDHDDWHKTHTSRPLNKFIKYEEGRDSFYRRNAMSTNNKEAMNALYKYRKYQHINFINFQNARDIEPDLVTQIAHGMFRCVKPGWTWFYNQKKMRSMWSDDKSSKFEGWKKPSFKDGFPDPAKQIPEVWKEYEEQSLEVLDNESQEEDEDESSESDENYLTVTSVAEKLDVSRDTIYRWIEDDIIPCNYLPNGKKMIPEKKLMEAIKEKNEEEEAEAAA